MLTRRVECKRSTGIVLGFAKEAIKMDFATIGRLSSYVKQKNLTFAAKHKIRTAQTLANVNGKNFIP